MSNRSADHRSYLSDSHAFATSAWNPFEIAHRWNSQAFAAYSTIGCEIQDFISRRINEDVALVHRVSHCRAHEEFVAAYADFWRKAAEDYGKETSTLAKLMINATSRMVAVGSTAMDEQRINAVPLREAAE